MKVLVVGASGLVGKALYDAFSKGHQTTGTYNTRAVEGMVRLDITDPRMVDDVIRKIKPDVILQPAANPNVELCEERPDETRRVNVAGSIALADAARSVNAKYVFFSSDYVFDGTSGPYTESDRPSPINEYGRQKLDVERYLQENLSNYLIIRVTVIYGYEVQGKNFVMAEIRNLTDHRPMKVPADQVGSPTFVRNLAAVVRELVESDRRGLFHVAGSDIMDRYAFALKVAETFGLDRRLLLPVTTDQLGQKARRPLKAGMVLDKVRGVVRTPLAGVDEGLRAMKQAMEEEHDR